MALLVYLVLYLYLHACSGRLLTVSDKGTVNKVTSVLQMDDQKPSSVEIKISYSSNVLLRATGKEIWKRAERSILESPPCNTEENMSSKDSDSGKDVDVMDYSLPRRKPPIHNKGT